MINKKKEQMIKIDNKVMEMIIENTKAKCKNCAHHKAHGDDCILCIFGDDFYKPKERLTKMVGGVVEMTEYCLSQPSPSDDVLNKLYDYEELEERNG